MNHRNGPIIVRRYASLSQAVAAAKAGRRSGEPNRYTKAFLSGDHSVADPSFTGGVRALDEYESLLNAGAPDTRRSLESMLNDARRAMPAPAVRCVRRRRRLGPDGDDVDLERFRDFRYDSMFESFPRSLSAVGRPTAIRIAIAETAASNRDASTICWRAVAAIIAADAVEAAGGRVEIVSYEQVEHAYIGDPSRYFATTVIKSADAVLDIPSIAMVAHPSTLRILACAMIEAAAPGESATDTGFGCPIHGAPLVPFEDGAPCVFIEDVWSRDGAILKAKEVIARFNGAPNH